MSFLMSKFAEMPTSYTDELYDEPILRKPKTTDYSDNSFESSTEEPVWYSEQEGSSVRYTSERLPEDTVVNVYPPDDPSDGPFTGVIVYARYIQMAWFPSSCWGLSVIFDRMIVEDGYVLSAYMLDEEGGFVGKMCFEAECESAYPFECGRNQAILCSTSPSNCDCDCVDNEDDASDPEYCDCNIRSGLNGYISWGDPETSIICGNGSSKGTWEIYYPFKGEDNPCDCGPSDDPWVTGAAIDPLNPLGFLS